MMTTAQPQHYTYTATPQVPPPASVHMVGVSGSSSVSVIVTAESKPDQEIPTTLKTTTTKISIILAPVSKHQWVTTTLISPSTSMIPLTSSTASISIVVVPKLAILADAYLEHLNKAGRDKDYLC